LETFPGVFIIQLEEETLSILRKAFPFIIRLIKPVGGKGIRFNESTLAHKYLNGLSGIEIGGSAHNPFGLKKCRNVDFTADMNTVFKMKEEELCGRKLPVDIVANGDDLPFSDDSLDYVVSSHVIEHFFDPIKTLEEWMRVIKKGGYIFIICPHVCRVPDEHRPVTTLKELIDRHEGRVRKEDVSMNLKKPNHWSVWSTEAFLKLCSYLDYTVVEFQDVDDKVGNGFAVVIKK
jgi:SAM-dependent methyltransferase